MQLPNKITIARVVLIPLFMAFILIDAIPYHYLFALLVFAIASLSDYFDGKIARERNLVSDFGKFLDPLADKLLVFAALICMIPLRLIHAVPVFVIIVRETTVNGLRFIAASKGVVIAANIFGKIKTALQMISVCVSLGLMGFIQLFGREDMTELFKTISVWLWWIVAGYTLVTLFIYLKKNISFIDPRK